MTLSLGAPANAQVATGVAGVCWLIELDFDAPAGGTQRYTTAPVDVPAAGYVYKGLANAVQVGPVTESEDTNARQIVITFTAATLLLGQVLGGVQYYRGRRVRLYLQLLDASFKPVLSRNLRWGGRMEPVRVPRSGQALGPGTARVELPCSRSGLPHARAYQGLRHTHAQQLARYPGNLCLQYLAGLINKPALWLSKRFQEI